MRSTTYYPVYNVLLLLGALLPAGCEKFMDVAPPTDLRAAAFVFSTDATATATVTGIYGRLVDYQDQFSDFSFSLYPGLLADELNSTAAVNSTRDPFQYNTLLVSNSMVAAFWKRGFERVYQANACIEGLEQATTLTDTVRTQLLAESRLMRAFFYDHLVNLFGEVPLETTTDYKRNEVMPRAPVAELYAFMIADASYAAIHLPSWRNTRVRFRPSREAAYALLAKLYLYQGDWSNANRYATKVIEMEEYGLEPNLQQVFAVTSNEAIWQLGSTAGVSLVQQALAYIAPGETVRPQVAVSQSLLQAFEPNDRRKESWLKSSKAGGATWYYPYKYKQRTGVNTSECITLFRLAELYLLRAEALARQQQLSAALSDLERIRHRAGLLPPDPAATQQQLLQAIARERRIELMFEWGNRWYDLNRTGAADTVLLKEKGAYWQTTDLLLPVPEEEILRNSRLEQNPGYH
jgi:hypothetical protein